MASFCKLKFKDFNVIINRYMQLIMYFILLNTYWNTYFNIVPLTHTYLRRENNRSSWTFELRGLLSITLIAVSPCLQKCNMHVRANTKRFSDWRTTIGRCDSGLHRNAIYLNILLPYKTICVCVCVCTCSDRFAPAAAADTVPNVRLLLARPSDASRPQWLSRRRP